jgi:hypothetical protein
LLFYFIVPLPWYINVAIPKFPNASEPTWVYASQGIGILFNLLLAGYQLYRESEQKKNTVTTDPTGA